MICPACLAMLIVHKTELVLLSYYEHVSSHCMCLLQFLLTDDMLFHIWIIVTPMRCIRYQNPHFSIYVIKISRPRQNGWHFPKGTFKFIILNENVKISNAIWLKFLPNGPIDNKRALVQIMALCQWWPTFVTHICLNYFKSHFNHVEIWMFVM